MNTTELKALADQCICHPVSRGIGDIEAAGEGIKTLIADLESAQDERRALLATEQNLRERVKALEEGLGGLMFWDSGDSDFENAARALLEKTT